MKTTLNISIVALWLCSALVARSQSSPITQGVGGAFTPDSAGDPVNAHARVMEASDGQFYLTTSGSGADPGRLYRLDPDFDHLGIDLNETTYLGSGALSPADAPVEASDGNLYGLTQGRVANGNLGTIYRIPLGFANNSTDAATVYTFPAGALPVGSLVPDGNGNFYGLTSNGGVNGQGSLFVFDLSANTVTTVYSFSCAVDGCHSQGTPLVASDGNVYGTNFQGGCGADGVHGIGVGTAWVYRPATQTHQVIGCFSKTVLARPAGGLVEAGNGLIYGTTQDGGTSGGALWSLDPSTLTLAVADEPPGVTTLYPRLGTPFLDASGNILFAGMDGNKPNNLGQIHAFDTSSGTDTMIYAFPGITQGTQNPYVAPIIGGSGNGNSGNLWGTFAAGDYYNNGGFYEFVYGATPPISLTPSYKQRVQGHSVTLNYGVLNAYSDTAKACFATSTDGSFTGPAPLSGSLAVTPAAVGTYYYGYSCGGTQGASARIDVIAHTCDNVDFCIITGASYNFGNAGYGTTKQYEVKIHFANFNDTLPVNFSLTGSSHFTKTSNCPATEKSGRGCEVTITYTAPNVSETDTATLTFSSNSGTTYYPGNTVSLTATSVP